VAKVVEGRSVVPQKDGSIGCFSPRLGAELKRVN